MNHFYWLALGALLVVLELVVPGGIIVFLGLAAITVGLAINLGLIQSLVSALIAWFVISLVFVLVLRSFFMKFFEGDTKIDNVDENKDIIGAVVEVCDDILPHREGRVRFRATTWTARSEEELKVGRKVRVINQDGSTLIVKTI